MENLVKKFAEQVGLNGFVLYSFSTEVAKLLKKALEAKEAMDNYKLEKYFGMLESMCSQHNLRVKDLLGYIEYNTNDESILRFSQTILDSYNRILNNIEKSNFRDEDKIKAQFNMFDKMADIEKNKQEHKTERFKIGAMAMTALTAAGTYLGSQALKQSPKVAKGIFSILKK